jgi:hypothetical protein
MYKERTMQIKPKVNGEELKKRIDEAIEKYPSEIAYIELIDREYKALLEINAIENYGDKSKEAYLYTAKRTEGNEDEELLKQYPIKLV